MNTEKLKIGDIVRNPWAPSRKQDFIFIRRGKRYCHFLDLEYGYREAMFDKKDVDENFTKVGHSAGLDKMFLEVTKHDDD
ncbi:hypothetical protein [Lacticaseibacillus salsurivasis]|uniref:hypothetical protein n=1 Tax=Lacticaseibacillus salsurivasis TaxID=3081441 RepID=UPI0030C6814C